MKRLIFYVPVVAGVLLAAGAMLVQAKGNDLVKEKHERHAAVCVGRVEDSASCHAHVITDEQGRPKTAAAPTGYGPVQFHGAYAVPTR